MTGSYIRKFSPNKLHIAAAALLLISLILLIIGGFRAMRVMFPDKISSSDTISEGQCIELDGQPELLYGSLKGSSNHHVIEWADINGRRSYIINIGGKFRPLTSFDAELDEWIQNGGIYSNNDTPKLIGIVTKKYSTDFMNCMRHLSGYYGSVNGSEDVAVIAENCSELGIKAVDPAKEKRCFLWGMPFLIAGLIILRKAGSPFFNFPENTPE